MRHGPVCLQIMSFLLSEVKCRLRCAGAKRGVQRTPVEAALGENQAGTGRIRPGPGPVASRCQNLRGSAVRQARADLLRRNGRAITGKSPNNIERSAGCRRNKSDLRHRRVHAALGIPRHERAPRHGWKGYGGCAYSLSGPRGGARTDGRRTDAGGEARLADQVRRLGEGVAAGFSPDANKSQILLLAIHLFMPRPISS